MKTAALHHSFAENAQDFTDFNMANVGNEHHNRRNTMNFNRNHQSKLTHRTTFSPQPIIKPQSLRRIFAEIALRKHGNNMEFRHNPLLFRHFDIGFRRFDNVF